MFGVPAGIWLSLLRPLALCSVLTLCCVLGRASRAERGLPPASHTCRPVCPCSGFCVLRARLWRRPCSLAATARLGPKTQECKHRQRLPASYGWNPCLHPLLPWTRLWPACPLCPCRAQLHQDSWGLRGHSGGTDVRSIVPLRAAPERGAAVSQAPWVAGFLGIQIPAKEILI